MSLSNLQPSKGSVKNRKRIGRGNATGQGRTAGKGHKGYKSRSGAGGKLHFEGGQMPLMRRLPKRGFSNYPFRKKVYIVDLGKINNLKEDDVDSSVLLKYKLIKNNNHPIKILSNGNLDSPKTIKANSFSHSAIEKIEKAGGKAINIW